MMKENRLCAASSAVRCGLSKFPLNALKMFLRELKNEFSLCVVNFFVYRNGRIRILNQVCFIWVGCLGPKTAHNSNFKKRITIGNSISFYFFFFFFSLLSIWAGWRIERLLIEAQIRSEMTPPPPLQISKPAEPRITSFARIKSQSLCSTGIRILSSSEPVHDWDLF
jgi:hypothetical protein